MKVERKEESKHWQKVVICITKERERERERERDSQIVWGGEPLDFGSWCHARN